MHAGYLGALIQSHDLKTHPPGVWFTLEGRSNSR